MRRIRKLFLSAFVLSLFSSFTIGTNDLIISAFIRSTNYQLTLNEEPAGTKTLSADCKDGQTRGGQSATNESETSLGRDTAVNKPLPDAAENSTEDCTEKPRENDDDSPTVKTVTTVSNAEEQQHSNFQSTDSSEQKENEIPVAVGGNALEQRHETAPGLESNQQVGPGLVAQPEKVRRSKLDKLRELGIDLTIKPRICSDSESFINLDESDSNKGIIVIVVILSALPSHQSKTKFNWKTFEEH